MAITTKIPKDLEARFRREVERLYGAGGTAKALKRAIELWLRETKDEIVPKFDSYEPVRLQMQSYRQVHPSIMV